MKRLVLAASSLFLVSLGGPVAAQQAAKTSADDVFARGCGDDRGVDRCADAVQNDMRTRYGIAAAQELVDRGVTFRRVMLVDGYGHDVVAITAHRSPGSAPVIEVRVPGEKGDASAPLQAALDVETWDAFLRIRRISTGISCRSRKRGSRCACTPGSRWAKRGTRRA